MVSMARRKRLCMISTKAESEQPHNEAQSQSNGHSTKETNDAKSCQMDTTTNEHSDNQNELGGPPKNVRGPTQKKELWNMHKNKIVVKFNKYGKPVGVERNTLTQFQGSVVRIAKQKRIGRSKMEDPHVIGTKSFARFVGEEATKNNGVQPTREKLYQISRTRKDDSIINDKAAQVMASLQVIADQNIGTTNLS